MNQCQLLSLVVVWGVWREATNRKHPIGWALLWKQMVEIESMYFDKSCMWWIVSWSSMSGGCRAVWSISNGVSDKQGFKVQASRMVIGASWYRERALGDRLAECRQMASARQVVPRSKLQGRDKESQQRFSVWILARDGRSCHQILQNPHHKQKPRLTLCGYTVIDVQRSVLSVHFWGFSLDSMSRAGSDIPGEVALPLLDWVEGSRSELDLLILLFETRRPVGLTVP